MTYTIAMAGKGGTGKTTLAGLLIRYLAKNDKSPILAVDADCNSNLNDVLGVEVTDSLGQAREDMKKGEVPSGMTKDVFMSMRMEQAVVETKAFDLLTMGQPEGAGCYCAANSLLAGFLEKLTKNYPYMVMDNEAGMEHISRLTTRNVDVLLVVADASRRGLEAAFRIRKLASDLHIGVKKNMLVLNRTRVEPSKELISTIGNEGLELGGVIPDDPAIYEYDLEGRPTYQLPEDSPAVRAAFGCFAQIVD